LEFADYSSSKGLLGGLPWVQERKTGVGHTVAAPAWQESGRCGHAGFPALRKPRLPAAFANPAPTVSAQITRISGKAVEREIELEG